MPIETLNNGMSATEQQDQVWNDLRRELGADADKIALALTLPLEQV